MAHGPYSRHYWRLVDDPKFDGIYADDHHYATWSRLLMIADQAWPASAHLPASARKASVDKLAANGLIELLTDGRYKVCGLDALRSPSSERAQYASNARWNAGRNAERNAGSAQEKRVEEKSREYSRMVARREKDYRETGVWFDEYGPKPDEVVS